MRTYIIFHAPTFNEETTSSGGDSKNIKAHQQKLTEDAS